MSTRGFQFAARHQSAKNLLLYNSTEGQISYLNADDKEEIEYKKFPYLSNCGISPDSHISTGLSITKFVY